MSVPFSCLFCLEKQAFLSPLRSVLLRPCRIFSRYRKSLSVVFSGREGPFTPSPGNSSVWRAQKTTDFCRKRQVGLRHLRSVTFSSVLAMVREPFLSSHPCSGAPLLQWLRLEWFGVMFHDATVGASRHCLARARKNQ